MNEIELKIRSRDINTLIKCLKKYSSEEDIRLIRKAYDYALEYHRGQNRLSGEPYITHPLEVAIILAKLSMEPPTVTAGLLHDVVEDTASSLEDLGKVFSPEIAALVNGVTKISYIKNRSKAIAQAETLKKMLMATIDDPRVIIIKLADKLHNMRTLMFQPEDKQEHIARETLNIYAPIAKRLGIQKISTELEDLAFLSLYPEEYRGLKLILREKKDELSDYFSDIKKTLTEELVKAGISAEITARAKHYYSIYKKMTNQSKTINEIYDIRAIRVITDTINDCYHILGIVHNLWTPMNKRFKDYIGMPKSNMYQSLHTGLMGPGGFPFEVQIRTWDMHKTAEMGIASHWAYKEKPPEKRSNLRNIGFLQNINKLESDSSSIRDFITGLKNDLASDEIFVFTPQGKIITLQKNATPVDFAYAIHTDVGNKTIGAKINSKIAPLKTKLKNNDIVEILTGSKGRPSEAWLRFATSSRARAKIRAWLKKNDQMHQEKPADEQNKKKEQKAVVSIPVDEHIKLKTLSKKDQGVISVNGTSNILMKLSQCCQPIPGDRVLGFITRGRGITIHKISCPSLKRLNAEKERIVEIRWEFNKQASFPVKVAVEALDRPSLLKDIATVFSNNGINIITADISSHRDSALFKFTIEVRDTEHLNTIITQLKTVKKVLDAYKLNEKVVIR